MILENVVHFIGALLKHLIGVLLLCWRRMLRAGLIAFFIGLVMTLLVTVVVTGKPIPSASALIVALLLGLALAYGVALTVMVEEMILGAIDLIKMLEGDIAAGAHIAEVVAEREVGQVGQGLRRFMGLPVSERPPARPGATLPPTPRFPAPSPAPRTPVHRVSLGAVEAGGLVAGAAALGGAALAESRRAAAPAAADLAPTTPDLPPDATDEAMASEPGAPVPADRLPRISWTYEHEAVRPAAAPATPDPAPVARGGATSGSAFSPAPGLTPNDPAPMPAPPIPAVEALSPPPPIPFDGPGAEAAAPNPVATDSALPDFAAPLATEPVGVANTPVDASAEPVASEIMDPAGSEPGGETEAEPAHHAGGLGALLGAGALGTLAEVATGVVAAHARDLFTHHHTDAEPEALAPAAPAPETANAEPYEDERLAAPLSVATPEGPAEPAERVDEELGEQDVEMETAPLPTVTPDIVRDADRETEMETAPLPAVAPISAPALMGQPAPATTPFLAEPEAAPLFAPPEPAPAPAPTASPEPDYTFQVMPEPPTKPAPATTPMTAPAPRVAADTRPIAPAVELEPAVEPAPASRADGARRTLPLGGAATDGAAASAPGDGTNGAASAPESGLWERLSSALIHRASAPSSPFAPAPSGDQPASEVNGAAEPGDLGR